MAEPPAVRETLDHLAELLRQLPEEDKAQFIQVVTKFSGPLPPPEDFAQYERTLPDTANRIVTMAEKALDGVIADAAQARRNERLLLNGSTVVSLALLGVAAVATWLENVAIAIPLGLGGSLTAVVRYLFEWLKSRHTPQ